MLSSLTKGLCSRRALPILRRQGLLLDQHYPETERLSNVIRTDSLTRSGLAASRRGRLAAIASAGAERGVLAAPTSAAPPTPVVAVAGGEAVGHLRRRRPPRGNEKHDGAASRS